MALLFTSPRQKATDLAGDPVPGAKIAFYSTITSTLQPVYANAALTIFLPNPVVADANGLFPVIYGDDSLPPYKEVFLNPDGTLAPEGTVDPYNPTADTFELTASEIAAGLTLGSIDATKPPNTSLRYKLIPNLQTVAGANTQILKSLVSPEGSTGTFSGAFDFVNTTGSDIYYFSDVITWRDGCHIDLNGCTLQLTKSTADPHDINAGFIFAVRDFSIENGAIIIDYSAGPMAAFAFGARNNEAGIGAFFQGSYDSVLTAAGGPGTQGNIVARNLRISTNAPKGYGFILTGGLDTVTIENIIVDGQSKAASGLDYEFGFATNGGGVGSGRLSSHIKNFVVRNFKVINVTVAGLGIRGAYNFLLENIYVNNAKNAVVCGTGEAAFYQVWADDNTGKKTTKRLTNIIGQNLTADGIVLDGTVNPAGTYLGSGGANGPVVLGNPPLSAALLAAARKDLGYFTLDGFCLGGTVAGNGVILSGATQDIRNGVVSGFAVGVFSFAEAGFINLVNVKAAGCQQDGFQLGRIDEQAGNAYQITKIAMRNCIAINNSQSVAGAYNGVSFYNCDSALVENCRFNAELAFGDAADEITQGNAVYVDTTTRNVVCRNNRVGVVPAIGSNVAYYNVNATPPNTGHVITGASGTATMRGIWGDGVSDYKTLTYAATPMIIDASLASDFSVTLTDSVAHSFGAPLSPRYGQKLTLTIRANTASPATATFNAIFKMSTYTPPANQFSRTISWRWNNTNWVQLFQSVDVPL